jgi:hypothetical protein
MPHNETGKNNGWTVAQRNPTYRPGALSEDEGSKIKWHSPESPASSQVFCVSAFGALRALPDGNQILNRLFAETVPNISPAHCWDLKFEHVEEDVLGETGLGTPTNIDVFCVSPDAAVCIESKFLYDANEGFGGCGQFNNGDCAGFHGPKSDRKTGTQSYCRLEIQEGKRDPRKYWQLGRTYFQHSVFKEQKAGETCPLAKSNYQLMRNFLFAATKAGERQEFGVLAMVPKKTGATVGAQVSAFQEDMLSESFRSKINVGTYDTLAAIMLQSPHQPTITLGEFLHERMKTVL